MLLLRGESFSKVWPCGRGHRELGWSSEPWPAKTRTGRDPELGIKWFIFSGLGFSGFRNVGIEWLILVGGIH